MNATNSKQQRRENDRNVHLSFSDIANLCCSNPERSFLNSLIVIASSFFIFSKFTSNAKKDIVIVIIAMCMKNTFIHGNMSIVIFQFCCCMLFISFTCYACLS